MNDVAGNERWLNEQAQAVRASMAEIQALRDQLSYLQLGWRPPDGGWSIGQVFEHLIVSDGSYLPEMRRLVRQGTHGDARWKPSFFGGLLARSVAPTSKRKLPAPRAWRPAPEPRADVVAEYLRIRQDLLELIESARGVDLRNNRMRSPAARFISLNLGDAINVLVLHAQRHLQQIRRLVVAQQANS